MSWHFLQEQEAAYWEGNSLGGAPSALLKLMPTPAAYCSPDKLTDASNRSPFGMTLRRLTDARGAEVLMWFQGDSPVRTYLPPEKEPESVANDPACGPTSPGSSAKFNPASYGWKTRQCSLFGGLESFVETWPRWGMTRRGELFPLPTPALHTCENESGLWPTPRAGNPGSRPNGKGGKILAEEVQIAEGLRERGERWPTPHGFSKDGLSNGPSGNELGRAVNRERFPTPRSEDSQCAGGHRGKDDTLYGMICRPREIWATPSARDWKDTPGMARTAMNPDGSTRKRDDQLARQVYAEKFPTPTKSDVTAGPGCQGREGGENLRTAVGGSLNPTWVEWLMGWPLGWTDLKPLETDKFRQWLCSHGKR